MNVVCKVRTCQRLRALSMCRAIQSQIAIRMGRKIRWDPVKERILGGDEAAQMLERPMRKPWRL